MLHRITSTPTWPQGRTAGWQRDLRAGLNSTLARYLLVLVAICALGCAYLWQASDLSELQQKTAQLEFKAAELEKENVRLAEQTAHWNAPAYIERRMREEGYVKAQSVVYTQLPAALVQPVSDGETRQIAQSPSSQ